VQRGIIYLKAIGKILIQARRIQGQSLSKIQATGDPKISFQIFRSWPPTLWILLWGRLFLDEKLSCKQHCGRSKLDFLNARLYILILEKWEWKNLGCRGSFGLRLIYRIGLFVEKMPQKTFSFPKRKKLLKIENPPNLFRPFYCPFFWFSCSSETRFTSPADFGLLFSMGIGLHVDEGKSQSKRASR